MITHIWQSTLFAAVAGLLTLLLRKNRARTRYWVWFVGLVKFLIPFGFLVSLGSHLTMPQWTPKAPVIAQPAISFVMDDVMQPRFTAMTAASRNTTDFLPAILLGIWACGFVAIAACWVRRWMRVRADVRLALKLPIDIGIPVVSSPVLCEPGVFGIFHPVLILPDGMAEQLSKAEWEAILAHELCHVRCHDNLTAVIYMLVESLFWFHPLVWWMGTRLVAERERACDEEVLRLGSDPKIYAESILKVCELYLRSPLKCVAGVTGSNLRRRIRGILTHPGTIRMSLSKKLLLAAAGVIAVMLPLIVGGLRAQTARQTAVLPAFGIASIAVVKAGDRAPEIDWTKIVQSPESAKYQPSLTGQYTVLQFLPPVTANAQAIGRWNELIEKFKDQPVQFVWIASEKWSVVQPFLREHPMNSWLLIDEEKEASRAYGFETGGDVYVDPSGKIVGFTLFPDAQQLAGVLSGKAVAIPRETADDQVFKLLEGGKVRLETDAEQWKPRHAPEKPDIAPSYEVHISPSKKNGTEGSAGPDFWVQRGFDLKTIVSMVYEKDLSRVVLPKALDNSDTFDFVVALPKEEDEHTIHQLVERAIEKRFKVSAAVESKPVEIYVMTAIKGKTPPAKTGDESFGGGSIASSGFEYSVWTIWPEAINKAVEALWKRPENIGLSNISARNTRMDDFRKALERGLGRPVIDETGLEGVYDLKMHGEAKNAEEFLRMLREQMGLVLTPDTRSIEILTLRSFD